MKLESLDSLLLHELRDLYSAEKQLVAALPKLAKHASSDKLREAFEEHLEVTRGHQRRLEEIFEELETTPGRQKCKAMEGLIKEGEELLKEDTTETVLDAAMIAAAQRVEHYEIAGYGSARTHAEQLGRDSIVERLQETLDEEKEADETLTEIALASVNAEAEASTPKE